MYRCLECGILFEEGEQKTYRECVGECHGSPAYTVYSGCPICGGNYEEIEPCRICGGYNLKNEDDFCEECQKNVMERFNNLMKQNFTEEEIELLKEQEEYGLL